MNNPTLTSLIEHHRATCNPTKSNVKKAVLDVIDCLENHFFYKKQDSMKTAEMLALVLELIEKKPGKAVSTKPIIWCTQATCDHARYALSNTLQADIGIVCTDGNRLHIAKGITVGEVGKTHDPKTLEPKDDGTFPKWESVVPGLRGLELVQVKLHFERKTDSAYKGGSMNKYTMTLPDGSEEMVYHNSKHIAEATCLKGNHWDDCVFTIAPGGETDYSKMPLQIEGPDIIAVIHPCTPPK